MAAPIPATNNTLVLALPPGMTGEQYLSLQGQLVTISICVAAAFAIVLWNYLITFKDEWTLYTSSNSALWKQPGTWAFIVLRYAALVATGASLFFTSLQSAHCGFAVRFASLMVAVIVAAAGCIFCYRVIALWKGNKLVYATVGFFYLAMLGCWFSTASTYDAVTGPPTPFNSNCQLGPVAVWNPISFASSVLFDIVVLALTMLKLRSNKLRSAVHQQLYNDNLAYFGITTVTNITVLVINTLGDEYALVKPAAVPFSTVITVAMAQRVYLNLRLLYKRQASGDVTIGMADSLPRVRPPPMDSFMPIKRDGFGTGYVPSNAQDAEGA